MKQRLGFFFTRVLIEAFRWTPMPVLYLLSDGLAFVLQNIAGYRRQVVMGNLERSFPEKTAAERRTIARKAYRNLTDVMLETIKTYTLPVHKIRQLCPPINPEVVNSYLDRGQSVILCGSHFSNWEFTGIILPPIFRGGTVTAYKPLRNKQMDKYVNRARMRTGMILAPMNDVFMAIRQRERERKPSVYVLLADQSPSSHKSAQWVEFLGQDTASLPGTDVLARKFNLPVLYYHIRRVSRGLYEVEFSEIWVNPKTAMEGDITRAYARRLETYIRQQPENWLWSHKRWKIKR